jgi:hypothetical protein
MRDARIAAQDAPGRSDEPGELENVSVAREHRGLVETGQPSNAARRRALAGIPGDHDRAPCGRLPRGDAGPALHRPTA